VTTRCKVVIELEIEGTLEHAIGVIEDVLDWGSFQNEINNWNPEERPVCVVSALCRMGEPDECREP
jgi:hypothetical protein